MPSSDGWVKAGESSDQNPWQQATQPQSDDGWVKAGTQPDPPPQKGFYSRDAIKSLLGKNGANPQEAEMLSHIAMSESAGDPNASNHYQADGKTYQVHSLFQVSDINAQPGENLKDPTANAKAALRLYRSQGTKPWESSRNGGAYGGWGQYERGNEDPRKFGQALKDVRQPDKPDLGKLLSIPNHSGSHPSISGLFEMGRPRQIPGYTWLNDRWVSVKEAANFAAHNPLEAASNLEATGQRAVASIAGDIFDGGAWRNPLKTLKNAGVSTIRPEDNQIIVNHLENAILRDFGWHGDVAKMQGIGKSVADFFVETGTDPLTYVPGADIFTVGARTIKTLAAASHAADVLRVSLGALKGAPLVGKTFAKGLAKMDATHKSVMKEAGDLQRSMFNRRPDLDHITDYVGKVAVHTPFFTGTGKLARMAIENGENFLETGRLEANADLLHRYKTELQGLKYGDEVPKEVQRHLLMEAWIHGNADARKQAQEHLQSLGMPVTQAELTKHPKPLGNIDYQGDIQKNYVSKVIPKSAVAGKMGKDAMSAFQWFDKKASKIEMPFAKPVSNKLDPKLQDFTMYDLIKNRLTLGNAAIRRQAIASRTARLYQEHGGAISQIHPNVAPENLADWFATHAPDRSGYVAFGDKASGQAIQGLSSLFKRAILGNFIPHGVINVGTVLLAHTNPYVAVRGLVHGIKGVPPQLLERLEATGGRSSFWREGNHTSIMAPWFKGNEKLLDRFETGYRASYLQYLDKTMPAAPKGTEALMDLVKGQKVNETIGDYANPTKFVGILKAMGGLYDTFRFDVVPKAGVAAIKGRVGQTWGALGRAEEAADENTPGEHQHIFGPLEDFTELLSAPEKFVTSVASIGPIAGGIVEDIKKQSTHAETSLAEDLGYIAKYLVPDLGLGQSIIKDTSENDPEWVKILKVLRDTIGGYGQPTQSNRSRHADDRAFNRASGN